MIVIKQFQKGMEEDLWNVYFSAIHQVCSQDYSTEQVNAWAPKDFNQNDWNEKMRDIIPFVAIWHGKIIGYADIQDTGLIDHFFVHGQHQAKGAGTALMNSIFKTAKHQKKLHSHVSITATPFFLSKGFKVITQQEVEIRACKMKNNTMEKQT